MSGNNDIVQSHRRCLRLLSKSEEIAVIFVANCCCCRDHVYRTAHSLVKVLFIMCSTFLIAQFEVSHFNVNLLAHVNDSMPFHICPISERSARAAHRRSLCVDS